MFRWAYCSHHRKACRLFRSGTERSAGMVYSRHAIEERRVQNDQLGGGGGGRRCLHGHIFLSNNIFENKSMPSTQTSGREQSAGRVCSYYRGGVCPERSFFQEGVFTGAPYPRAVAVEAGGRDSSGWPCSGGRPQSLTPPPPLFLSLWSVVRKKTMFREKGVSN